MSDQPVQIPKVFSKDAIAALGADAKAVLIDVRTPAERIFVGAPDLSSIGKEALSVPVKNFNFETNSFSNSGDFVPTIEEKIPDKSTPLYFICRAGGRSTEGARLMHARGYTNLFDVTDGFEGPFINAENCKQRRTAQGWKNTPECPWKQS
eukprot:TRINITY_DN713_c0_g3_i1.p1 TRINITY_DN713_c0_g3~~TRINITY_DN713_c0_g3_i1.p1  ORF type:complete len:151 (+),score=36.64 TRINITY_DN713_c0_g3_i1:61-513(+)